MSSSFQKSLFMIFLHGIWWHQQSISGKTMKAQVQRKREKHEKYRQAIHWNIGPSVMAVSRGDVFQNFTKHRRWLRPLDMFVLIDICLGHLPLSPNIREERTQTSGKSRKITPIRARKKVRVRFPLSKFPNWQEFQLENCSSETLNEGEKKVLRK